MILIEVQQETLFENLPSLSQLTQWIESTARIITADDNKTELTIRFIDKKESTKLNYQYRYKKSPTNILSFPDEPIPGFLSVSFGDLAICTPLVVEEAYAQHTAIEAHFAHLVIHGFLHLSEYNHIEEKEAAVMESLEIKILSQLGYDNPYEE